MRQIPNLLGLFRVLATPFLAYMILMQTGWALIGAAILLFVMAMSDIVDGNLARRLGVVSPFGIFLDTISDKIFVAGALLPLVQIGLMSSWYALTIIVREFAVSGLRSYAATQGVVIPARAWGKQKLTLTVTGLIWLMVWSGLPMIDGTPVWLVWLSQWWYLPYGLALVWTIASGVEYFWNARELLQQAVVNAASE
ncbi:MAG: CDP-diacylglycerol--glycerol-3-phosphate 3-phosphatidyltransferase [Chloroflexia bacterium]|nr:CDP-diacylglycerol--glycerol-3-phosphate 3-phosphatidyltransferase [Chloroflexia bacterium]